MRSARFQNVDEGQNCRAAQNLQWRRSQITKLLAQRIQGIHTKEGKTYRKVFKKNDIIRLRDTENKGKNREESLIYPNQEFSIININNYSANHGEHTLVINWLLFLSLFWSSIFDWFRFYCWIKRSSILLVKNIQECYESGILPYLPSICIKLPEKIFLTKMRWKKKRRILLLPLCC